MAKVSLTNKTVEEGGVLIHLSYEEAQWLLHVTGFIGGPAPTTPRRLFSDSDSSLARLLTNMGVVKSMTVHSTGSLYFVER